MKLEALPLDLIAFVISCLLMLAYYLYLGHRTRKNPDASISAHNARIREQWVNMVMSKGNMDILAVQTIRNSLIAANFLASTAILLVIGTLNVSEKIGEWTVMWKSIGLASANADILWQIKLAFLIFIFAIAFHFFAMAIRYYNHVGYMISLTGDTAEANGLIHETCVYLNKAGRYYMFGTRTFFFSLLPILWFFGPIMLLLATISLIIGLSILDKTPS